MQSNSRNGATVRLLAVHTTEGIMRSPELRDFFNRANAVGSSHASADETGALLGPAEGFVPYDQSAWTLRNGNPISDNIELCGWASWKRADWLAREPLLDACARWLAERSAARGIPLVKIDAAGILAGQSGVIGHIDWTNTGDGSHWDPGPEFPYDVVLDKARAYANGSTPGDDMTPEQSAKLDTIHRLLTDDTAGKDRIGDIYNAVEEVKALIVGRHTDGSDRLADIWRNDNTHDTAIETKLDAITAALAKLTPPAKP